MSCRDRTRGTGPFAHRDYSGPRDQYSQRWKLAKEILTLACVHGSLGYAYLIRL